MHHHQFDAVTQFLTEPSSRRDLTRGLTGSGWTALAGWSLAAHEVAAKKKRKNKKNRCLPCSTSPPAPPPLSPPAPTCDETCGASCTFCFIRPGAPTLCGDNSITDCTDPAHPCSSDNTCVGNVLDVPYCVSHIVNRATGAVRNACGSNDPGAFCTSIDPCT